MINVFKALGVIAAVIAVIAAGLYWPSDDASRPDEFRPDALISDLQSLGEVGPDIALNTMVNIHPSISSREDILGGRYKYVDGEVGWRFSPPIDWGAPPEGELTQRVVQRLAHGDPFLQSYADTGNIDDFRQAVFFMLDWSAFHQDGQRETPYAWDAASVDYRLSRLAYMLRQSEINGNLIPAANVRALIKLSDFHIQRVRDPIYGLSLASIESLQGITALCDVLDGLPSCQIEE